MSEILQDFFLGCKECVLENPRSFYGSFSLGPFKNSQSLTIANALRRTLLTEISNIAITHIEIDGVMHEYSTIEGVRESVLDILLNFKQIVLKTSFPLTKPLYGYLNVRGPGIVRVSDIKLPPNIYYVDPDQYIATLNENGNLSLKFTISDFSLQKKLETNSAKISQMYGEKISNFEFPGVNAEVKTKFHSPFDENDGDVDEFQNGLKQKNNERKTYFLSSSLENSEKKQNFKKTANSLWVDPNFNPILKVNYLIENLEPIQQSFQNQVVHVEIWTNGSIHPRKAFYLTFDFLKNIFTKFEDMKHVNLQFHSKFFESEETLNKILKSYEYDLGFYDVLNSKKLKLVSDSPLFLQLGFSSKFEGSPKNSFGKEKIENRDQVISYHLGGEKKELLPVIKLDLPLRITNTFIQNNLLTIGDILKFHPKELQNFCGIGNFSLCLIQKKLKKKGFFLKSEKKI